MEQKWTGISTGLTHNITTYDFDNFIECEVSPDICPLIWDSFSFIENFEDRRYCKYCDKTVYKVDNMNLFKELQDNNKCMVISKEIFENVNGKIDKEKYALLKNRLKLSELFLVVKHYSYESNINKNRTYKEKLKDIVIEIFSEPEPLINIEWLENKGVDMRFIFKEILLKEFDDTFIKKYKIQNWISG